MMTQPRDSAPIEDENFEADETAPPPPPPPPLPPAASLSPPPSVNRNRQQHDEPQAAEALQAAADTDAAQATDCRRETSGGASRLQLQQPQPLPRTGRANKKATAAAAVQQNTLKNYFQVDKGELCWLLTSSSSSSSGACHVEIYAYQVRHCCANMVSSKRTLSCPAPLSHSLPRPLPSNRHPNANPSPVSKKWVLSPWGPGACTVDAKL